MTLSLANDTSKVVDAVQGLVDQYNSLMSFIGDNLTVGDPSRESRHHWFTRSSLMVERQAVLL